MRGLVLFVVLRGSWPQILAPEPHLITPYYSMVISLAKSPLFSIAIHPMSVVRCKKVNRLRQVCHHWPSSRTPSSYGWKSANQAGPCCKECDGNDPHSHPRRLSKRVAGDGRLVAARRA